MTEGYDLAKLPDQQLDKFDPWDKQINDFYSEIVSYYKDSASVKCYEKGGKCDRESDDNKG